MRGVAGIGPVHGINRRYRRHAEMMKAHGDDGRGAGPTAKAAAVTTRDLLVTTARVMRANAPSFFLVTAVCTAPATLFALVGREFEAGLHGGVHGWTWSVVGILYLIGMYFAQASLIFATVEFLAGRGVAPHQSLTAAYYRLPSVLVVAFLAGAAGILGLLLVVVPGVLIWLALFAAIPAVVVEGLGPLAAIKRSAELTKGNRWTLFLASLVVGLVFVLLACCSLIAVGLHLLVSPPEHPTAASPGAQTILFVLRTFILVVTATLAGVFYDRVRTLRDRIEASAIADVFR